MRKDLLVVGVMLLIVVAAVGYGVMKVMHGKDVNKVPINTTVLTQTGKAASTVHNATTSTATVKTGPANTTKNATGPRLPAVANGSYILYSFELVNVTAHVPNTTVLYVNSTYYIELTGLFNYPPGYVQKGNYTLIMVTVSFTMVNGTEVTLYVPLYQNVVIGNQTTQRFVLQLEGNSTAVAQLYHYLTYLKAEGIYTVNVDFELMPRESYYNYPVQVEGVASI